MATRRMVVACHTPGFHTAAALSYVGSPSAVVDVARNWAVVVVFVTQGSRVFVAVARAREDM